METHIRNREIIEIDDDSGGESEVILEDFLTTEELERARNAIHGFPSSATINRPDSPDSSESPDNPDSSDNAQGTSHMLIRFEECQKQILDVFPDISLEHLKSLYDARLSRHLETVQPAADDLAQELITQILDCEKYPKESERRRELKRKRSAAATSDDERATKWRSTSRSGNELINYAYQAKMLIQEDFPTVPRRFIDSTFNQYNHLYATYLALDLAEHTFDTSAPKPYTKLKHKRKSTARALGDSSNMAMSYPTSLTAPEPNGYGITELHRELGAARGQRKKLQTGRQVKADAAAAEAAQEQEHRDNGDVMECQCCFDDTTINKITHCDGPEPHFFCFSCALRNANNEIGLGRHQLLCMDGSGCKAHFSRTERNRFLEPKLLSKLERSEQQAELKNAGLPNLASCPFCDFAAICSPVEVDREFRCYNPDCGRVSCRLCNLDTHIPLSCEEFKKENGLSERHVLEEARSAALIRQCPRCKTATIKEAGCNKVVCTCGGTICDFCGKDITNEGYNHFSDTVRGGRWLEGKKCPTYDDSHMRNEKRIEEAEEKALKKIQEENPNLSKADLEIKFAESVKRPFHGNRWGVPPPPPGGVPMALPPRGMVAQPPMRPNPDPFPNAMVPPPRYPDALNNVVNDREPWAERDEQQMEAEELRALELEYRREALDRLRGRPVLGNDPGQWQQRMDRVIEAQRQRIQRMLDDDQRGIEEEFRRQHERNIRPELPGYPPDIRPPYLNRRRDYNNDHLNLLEGFGEEEFGRPTRRHA